MTDAAILVHVVERESQDLERQISSGARGRVVALAEFAKRYSRDPLLHEEAVLLGMNTPLGEEVLQRQMRELMYRIVSDFQKSEGESAPAQRELAAGEERLNQWLAKSRVVAAEVVFRGSGLTKQYEEHGFRLEPLDLVLKQGEITGVVGQNAQGKTTLLRIVAGELRSDGGSLSYPALGPNDSSIDWIRVKEQVAFVPQDLPRWRGDLEDTLIFEASMRGVAKADIAREVGFVVERLDLGAHLRKRWEALSGGYRLRFALARALVWKPKLLVMDEPLANLDIKAKETLLQDVSQLASSYRYPIAVLMSSHELHGLERVCAQMVFLRQGRALFIGPADGVAAPTLAYELGTTLSALQLRDALKSTGVLDIHDQGRQFTITTDLQVTSARLLAILLEKGVPIVHFRDISRSVRRLFD